MNKHILFLFKYLLGIIIFMGFQQQGYSQLYTNNESTQFSALYFWNFSSAPVANQRFQITADRTNQKLTFNANNATRLTLVGVTGVSATGNNGALGINANSPSSVFHLKSIATIDNTDLARFESTTGSYFKFGAGVNNSANLELNTFASSGTQNLLLQGDGSAGNVGIGQFPVAMYQISAPQSKLHLQYGAIQVSQSGDPVAGKTGITMGAFGNAQPAAGSYSWIQAANGPLLLNPLSGNTLTTQTNNYVAIGIQKANIPASVPVGYNLLVQGKIMCEELKIKLIGGWYDHVFATDYKLMPLETLENYITKNNRLPDIPSAAEVEENGIMAGEMNGLLLKKVEELTLYMIEQNKTNATQAEQIELLKKQNELLMQQVQLLTAGSAANSK